MTMQRFIRPCTAVLFDLDGTLLDTAQDMAGALNDLRAEHGVSAGAGAIGLELPLVEDKPE